MRWCSVLLAVALSGCGLILDSTLAPDDGGGGLDASFDAGVVSDSGSPDSGGKDAGTPESDAGTPADSGPPACELTECGVDCVDINTDRLNCGGCGVVCGDGESCEAALCVVYSYTDVYAGGAHTCALTSDGGLHCFGDNRRGQLGIGVLGGEFVTPQIIESLGDVLLADTGDSFTCAANMADGLHCWGDGRGFRLGTGARSDVSSPTPIGPPRGDAVVLLSTGIGSSLTRFSDIDQLYGWGLNDSNQLYQLPIRPASIPPTSVPTPTASDMLGEVTSLAVGDGFACAVVDGEVLCWGRNDLGQLGRGTSDAAGFLSPGAISVPMSDLRPVQVATGDSFACALGMGGGVFCWGDNSSRQVSAGGGAVVTIPTRAGPFTAHHIAAGGAHACAIEQRTGHVICWGDNRAGQLGATSPGVPVGDPSLVAITLDCGAEHTCAVISNTGRAGDVFCWGSNSRGQLGFGARGTGVPPGRINAAVLPSP